MCGENDLTFLNFTFHVDAFISPYSNILSRVVHYHSQK